MAQVLKDDIRLRLTDSAEVEFASKGYAGTTMAAVARGAGLSTGNLYRYYANKAALFEAVVDQDFADSFSNLLDARVASLSASQSTKTLGSPAQHRQNELLEFLITNRRRVIILLERADGTPHEGFGARFVDDLVRSAKSHIDERKSKLALSANFSNNYAQRNVDLILRTIFDGARRAFVAILECHQDDKRTREAFALFWNFQLAGLAGFIDGMLK